MVAITTASGFSGVSGSRLGSGAYNITSGNHGEPGGCSRGGCRRVCWSFGCDTGEERPLGSTGIIVTRLLSN